MQAEENNSECRQVQQILAQLKQALDRGGASGLAIDGQVLLITQRVEQLLSQYFLSYVLHSLPETLQHWFKHQILQFVHAGDVPSSCLPLHFEQAGRQLLIRLIPDPKGEQYLLLLEEQESPSFSVATLQLLGLTEREAEVLFWIAKDKSNAGIARVLDCCEGTVRKHLEHLYKKLGVQTRTAAVMVALEKLGLFKG
ncbi:LuxR family transcriptional regulator [Chroococcidiopsis sp. CCALA 051]|nr:helix-turn-helix transcriptional regulator [Chroococcidiopsidales cyanobacterium LEGE 13417]PSM45634.1 LuxR family transcriptional regulator [Chroococcidiopsis sp. CCALA 051]